VEAAGGGILREMRRPVWVSKSSVEGKVRVKLMVIEEEESAAYGKMAVRSAL
jgi:hypothetical protein